MSTPSGYYEVFLYDTRHTEPGTEETCGHKHPFTCRREDKD
jgi:hypothetical protein